MIATNELTDAQAAALEKLADNNWHRLPANTGNALVGMGLARRTQTRGLFASDPNMISFKISAHGRVALKRLAK